VLARTARHELVARRLDLQTGAVSVEPAVRGQAFEFDGRTLRALFGPRWRLLIVGAGQPSRAVAQMALMLDFEVVVCDPREEYHLTWDVPHTTFSRAMPDDLVLELQLDPHSAVVAVTHDPKLDDMVLLEALKSPAFYVGALGSRGNTAKRKQRLGGFRPQPGRDRPPARAHRPGPRQQDAGGDRGVVVAEIIAVRNGVALAQKKAGSAVPALPPGAPSGLASDGVCGVGEAGRGCPAAQGAPAASGSQRSVRRAASTVSRSAA
jgi:xanthine dehydrogenase accessory factor